jgi:hypothetical protein
MVSRIRTLLVVMLAIAAGVPARSNAQTDGTAGAVFVMTNAASSNEVIAYKRNADGSLEQARSFPTGARQWRCHRSIDLRGSLTLTDDWRSTLVAAVRIPCNGNRLSGCIGFLRWHEPVAVPSTEPSYVVNAGGSSNVTGFRLRKWALKR